MPNIPSSSASTPAKKRKLSSIPSSSAAPTNIASIDVSLPIQPSGSGVRTGDELSNELVEIETSDDDSSSGDDSSSDDDSSTAHKIDVDDAILKSKVYQIYCRHTDPKEAMKEIGRLKSCWTWGLATKPFPSEEDFKSLCETALGRLWKLEPRLYGQINKIKKVVNDGITESRLASFDDLLNIKTFFKKCISWIGILLPNGYEFFYIANFEQGPGKSKWYRGESSKPNQDRTLAMISVFGINNSIISKLHYNQIIDHYLEKNKTEIKWVDFAKELILFKAPYLFEAPEGCKKGMLNNI